MEPERARFLVCGATEEHSGGMRITANRGLAVFGGAIVVIALVIAALSSSWTVPERDPKSPEGVVQAYLAAVYDRDAKGALALMEPDTECRESDFNQVYTDRSSRVDLVQVTVNGDAADVQVRIEHANGDPLGGTWTEEQWFNLERNGDSWRVQGPAWPLYNCGGMVK